MITLRKTACIGAILLTLVCLLFWSQSASPEIDAKVKDASHSPGHFSVALEPSVGQLAAKADVPPTPPRGSPMHALLQTPITFCGIVLDQDQQPVQGANVAATVLNNLQSGTPIATTSAVDGTFILRSSGASLHVRVSKNGYYDIDRGGSLKPTSQGFDFAADTGRGVHHLDPANPVVFHLRKEGQVVNLQPLNAQAKIPRNGNAVPIALSRDRAGTLTVKCESEAHTADSTEPFDWRCEIRVEGGGIQEALDDNVSEAPEHGYAHLVLIDMPKSLGPNKWRDAEIKSYWVRLPDNTFAKIRFRMIAGGDHFAVLDGVRNLSPNDRNLEREMQPR